MAMGTGRIRMIKLTVRILHWVALIACASELLASVPSSALRDYHHTSWTAETGLGALFDIQQAPDGYLWLTTTNGVFRFDGVRFESMDDVSNGAVRNRDIDSVFVARKGALWLSTRAHGLIRWQGGTVDSFPDRRCTPGLKTDAIKEAPDGSLWIQASAGLAHFEHGRCEPVAHDPANPRGFAAAILVDSRGALWVKMSSDLYRLPAGASKFERVPGGSASRGAFTFLREAPDKSIWLADDSGLRMIAGSGGTPLQSQRQLPVLPIDLRIENFSFAPDGTLWAATSRGVEQIDWMPFARTNRIIRAGEGPAFTPSQGLSSDVVSKIIRDREGTIWIGTSSGLDQLRKNILSSVPRPHSPEFQLAVAADSTAVWIGSRALPLSRVMPDGTLRTFPQTGTILALRRDFHGDIWAGGIGKRAKLWRFSGKEPQPVHYPHDDTEVPAAVTTDKAGGLWVSTFGPNVYHQAGHHWEWENNNLRRKPGVIGTMAGDADGNVWFAFSNSLVRWNGSGYDRYSFPDGALNISVTTLSVRNGRVWLAGLGGIVLFENGAFRKLQCKDSSLPGRVTGIVETRSGDLWANGFSGAMHVASAEIANFLRDPKYAVTAERIDAADGLPGLASDRFPEPSLVESPEGRLWFATSKGFAWLDPDRLASRRNRIPPPVHITSIDGDGRDYDPTRSVTLEARTTNVRIEYTALSLAIPERVRFRYKLEGMDQQWQNAGTRRQALYNNLPPGAYRFQVIACNNDGVWNEAGATLSFTMAPAWYQTGWFKLLAIALALGMILLLYLIERQRYVTLLRIRFDERLEERTRLARELHDTLLQTIQGSLMVADHARATLNDPSQIREMLDRLCSWLDRATVEGRAALNSLRSSATDREDLGSALRHTAELFAPENVQIALSVTGIVRSMHPIARDEVLRIGEEAVRNACKHSQASLLDIEARYGANLTLRVRDNGVGVAPLVLSSGKPGHFGLIGMRERATRIGARLALETSVGKGTCLVLTVPGRVIFKSSIVSWILQRLKRKILRHRSPADPEVHATNRS
jgi:signal transduction histidine kinase/ligand-binding sensor domain-containing protein